jgi:hypothetical protein
MRPIHLAKETYYSRKKKLWYQQIVEVEKRPQERGSTVTRTTTSEDYYKCASVFGTNFLHGKFFCVFYTRTTTSGDDKSHT